jgi:hypothetical protein
MLKHVCQADAKSIWEGYINTEFPLIPEIARYLEFHRVSMFVAEVASNQQSKSMLERRKAAECRQLPI